MEPPDHITFKSDSADETFQIAAALGKAIRAPLVITLAGPLGAGKTHFVRGLAWGMGIDPSFVSSPTFVICQEYGDPPALVHIDAYRVRSPDELDAIGWDELIRADDLVVAIEWPQHIGSVLPDERIDVVIEPTDETVRRILIANPESRIASEACSETCPHDHDESSIVNCRTCAQPVDRSNEHFPFCSDRCRLADLGRWFSGSFTISRELEEDDLWEHG